MIRKRIEWKFRGTSLTLGERTLIMGILNVTPDSFSDGGQYTDPDAALRRALQLQEQGADIIDIGAESTRPGSERVSEAEELRRLIPVLKKLKGVLDIPISVDTYKPAVAEKALEHGAHIINDVSGLTWEPELTKPVLQADAGLILNHMRGTPDQWARMAPLRDVMGEIATELEAAIHRARRAGIELDHVVIDPGLGFGKRREQNSEIIARIGELRRLILPVLIGPSRKSFLAREEPIQTDFATAAAVTASILNGAYLVRVHDVEAMKPVVETADAVIAAMPEPQEETKPRRSPRDIKREMDEQDEARLRPIRPPTKRVAPPVVEERPAEDSGNRPAYSRPRDSDRSKPIRPRRDDERGSRPAYTRDRDRKDDRGSRPPGKRDDRPPQRGGDRRDDRGGRPFRGREEGERPPYRSGGAGSRPPGRSGPPREEGERPSYRSGGAGSRPPGRSGPPRKDGERPSYRSGGAGSRPPGRSGPPRKDGDRPSYRSGGAGSRPPGRSGPPKREGGDRGGPKRGGGPGGRRGPSTPRKRE